MASVAELKRKAEKEGVPTAIVEKDLALSAALEAIAVSELSKFSIFKGGTAIRKVYFQDARFSVDLDFTVRQLGRADVLEKLSASLEAKTVEGVQFGQLEEEQTKEGLKVAVKYFGPLVHWQRIRFDFSFRDNLVFEPESRLLAAAYGIGGKSEINTMQLGEIMAEKIHALGSRSAPRDLYDIWFLHNKGVKADKEVVARKFKYYDETADVGRIMQNAHLLKDEWKKDMRQFVGKLPEFDLIFGKVKEELENELG